MNSKLINFLESLSIYIIRVKMENSNNFINKLQNKKREFGEAK